VNAVEFQGVSKSYSIYDSPGDRLKELLSLNRLKCHKDFWALHDVSFETRRGETFCSSAKTAPARARCCKCGRHSATHRGSLTVKGAYRLCWNSAQASIRIHRHDNVYLNGSILGLSTRQIDQRYKDIEDFAEIGDFINQPVKTYRAAW